MNLDLGNMDRLETNKEEKYIHGWSPCICPDPNCDLYFFQKSTILDFLTPYLKKWKNLPLNIQMRTVKNPETGFMTTMLIVEQIGNITKRDLETLENKR